MAEKIPTQDTLPTEETEQSSERPSLKDDFYTAINWEWLEETEVPPAEARWGAFDVASHRTDERLQEIAKSTLDVDNAEKGSVVQLVRDFYRSSMDMETRNSLGIEPLNGIRGVISNVENSEDAMRALAHMRLTGLRPFFSLGFGEDDKKAGSNALFISQGGLGLPSREYYLEDDESKQEVREKYKQYISNTFQLLGRTVEEADAAAEAVYQIEYVLAEISRPKAEAREIDKNYTKFSLDEARREFPGLDWDAFFGTLGKSDIKDFVIQQPEFIKKVEEILQTSDINDVKDYLEFKLLNSRGGALSQDFVDENFKFNGQVLSGMKEQRPLEQKTIIALNNSSLNEAIGPIYCERHFNHEYKENVIQMVADVTDAFRERVLQLDWMTPETKALTVRKLDNIVFKIGFPDQWLDLSDIAIRADSYVGNLMALSEFDVKRELARLDDAFDYDEWLMPPTTVNACSDLKREMTFPAAILQPPFYDPDRDDAYNYGAIGGVIGHELTHFFDDEGCKYDLEGNVNDWWTDDDRDSFRTKTEKFVDYFGNLEVNGLRVNGKLTCGENIADHAGVTIAYHALQKKLEREGGDETVDELGFTPKQRLFVGWARAWAAKLTPELAKQLIARDPHAPNEVRTNGVLAIVPEFYEAFNVTEGDRMYVAPEDQPKLW